MKNKIFLVTVLLFAINPLFADSPLTSTDFSNAYKDIPIVALALQTEGELTLDLMRYLENPKNPIQYKMAVINGLGWEFNGKDNAGAFFSYLNKKGKYEDISDFGDKASAHLLICMAYLYALDDYFDVELALKLAKKAKEKSKDSYTIHIICGIIEAQNAMEKNWCDVYKATNTVRENKSLKNDMDEEAINIIFEYMDLYESYCE